MVKSSNLVGQYAQRASIFTFVIYFKYTRDCFPDLIAYLPKNSDDLFFRARRFGWVLKAAVDTFPFAQPERASFMGIIANGDHKVEIDISKLVSVFGAPLVLNADFGENLDRFGVDIARGLRARAVRVPLLAVAFVDDRFCHLRPAGIPRA